MKILLLEDDLELCKNIKISLEKENYMVDCCNDGETAMLYADGVIFATTPRHCRPYVTDY